jgi:hypothetical protein
MTLFDGPAPTHDPVVLDLTFEDTWTISAPMPRFVAEAACFDFSQGVPWLNGLRVIRALIVPWTRPDA